MKRLALLLACVLCYTACNNEVEITVDQPTPAPSQQIQLFLPDMETVSVYSAATAAECTIDTLWVAVFDGNAKRWVEKIEGSRILNNGHETMLVPQLKHEIENGNTVVCIANPRYYNLDTTTLTLDRINDCFPVPFRIPYPALPMYGQIDSWSSTSVVCQMTRAVAKVQVQFGEAFESVYLPDVDDISYYVYNYTYGCWIKPQLPLVPSGSGSPFQAEGDVRYLLQHETATEAEKTRYVYEYPNGSYKIDNQITSIDEKKFDSHRTFVLLYIAGGQLSGQYYRLDFYDHATREYIDIKRNHCYLFTINKISSPGYQWPKWEECWYNPPSNIEYTVRVEDDSRSITSNGQYAVVTSVDTVKITGNVTDSVVTTYRYINQTGTPLTIWTDTIYVPHYDIPRYKIGGVLPPGARVEIISPPMNPLPITATGGKSTDLRITTRGDVTEATIVFQFGNIIHYLPIRKTMP